MEENGRGSKNEEEEEEDERQGIAFSSPLSSLTLLFIVSLHSYTNNSPEFTSNKKTRTNNQSIKSKT